MSEWLKTHLGSLILGRKEDLGAVIGFSNITGDPDAHQLRLRLLFILIIIQHGPICMYTYTSIFNQPGIYTKAEFSHFFYLIFITILSREISMQLIEVTCAYQQPSLNPILPFHRVSDYADGKPASFNSALCSQWMQWEPNLRNMDIFPECPMGSRVFAVINTCFISS